MLTHPLVEPEEEQERSTGCSSPGACRRSTLRSPGALKVKQTKEKSERAGSLRAPTVVTCGKSEGSTRIRPRGACDVMKCVRSTPGSALQAFAKPVPRLPAPARGGSDPWRRGKWERFPPSTSRQRSEACEGNVPTQWGDVIGRGESYRQRLQNVRIKGRGRSTALGC